MSRKLTLGFVAAGLLAALAVGAGAYLQSADVIEEDMRVRLEENETHMNASLDRYLKSVEADFAYMANARSSREALRAFEAGYATETPQALTTAYIDENPNPLGEKHLLDAAPIEGAYHAAHATYHPTLRTFLEARGYYDIFLISNAGDIVYSVYKERDYATNLVNGAYAASGLGRAAQAALNGQAGQLYFDDFTPYAPSAGAPAAFVATPVVDESGAIIGALAMQIPAEKVAAAIASGTASTTYVVGPDGFLRTDLEATEGSDILERRVSGDWLAAAQTSARPVVTEAIGVLGEDVMISAHRVDVLGASWVIVAEMPIEVAHAPLAELQLSMLGVILPTIALIAFLAFLAARGLSRSIGSIATAMNGLRRGKIDVDIPGADRGDEIGEMARALLVFRDNAGVQIAVTAAVDASRTAVLVLNGDGDRIASNPAFDELWRSAATAFGNLESRSADGETRNFKALIDAAAEAERAGRVLKKNDGRMSIELERDGLILEIKRADVLGPDGQICGQTLEIENVSAARKIESELLDVIAGVERGEFTHRVQHIDNFGFTSIASAGINKLMDAISSFMAELDRTLGAMASGDLTTEMHGAFLGDFASARDRFNGSIRSLGDTIEGVVSAAQRVHDEASPIAQGARDLASRAEAQASTLEETAATMEEMSAGIRHNAESAESAAKLSTRAVEQAGAGGEIVADTVSAMTRIEESSKEISDIITVIDGIAFQTNLLALNAAVEAARAGDAGKGFAVVAAEVRTLAQRSAEAAKDIAGLISTSTGHVSDGVRLVNRTGESLKSMASAIEEISSTINGISTAVSEQASGASEVATSVNHMDKLTQENAALADQSAAAANELLQAAEEMKRLMAAFKTAGSDTTYARHAA